MRGKSKIYYKHNSPQTVIRMILTRESYPELRFKLKNANLRFVKKFENTGSIEDGRQTNQRLKYARTPGVITKVEDMFAETPQITVCKLANSITENASSTSV